MARPTPLQPMAINSERYSSRQKAHAFLMEIGDGRRILDLLNGEDVGEYMAFGFHVSFWTVFLQSAPYASIGPVIILLLLVFRRTGSRGARGRYLLWGLFVLLVAFLFVLPLHQAGSGWTYSRGKVTVKTGFGAVELSSNTVHAQWVTHKLGYQLAARTDGISTAHLKAGHYTLKNGQSAHIFEYQPGKQINPVLALSSNKTLVLISSPKVKELMTRLQQVKTP